MFPFLRSSESTRQLAPPSVAVVTKTRSPQAIGEDQDSPGRGVFQATFSVALHLAGRPVSLEMHCAVGPRNCGQFSAEADVTKAREANVQRSGFGVFTMLMLGDYDEGNALAGNDPDIPHARQAKSGHSDGGGRI